MIHAVITETVHPNVTIVASPNGATESGNAATFTARAQVFTNAEFQTNVPVIP